MNTSNRYPISPSTMHFYEMREKLKKTKHAAFVLRAKKKVLYSKIINVSHDLLENWEEYVKNSEEAFILLASAKYYNSTFFKFVQEDIPNQAQCTSRSQPVKESINPYPLLGLAFGAPQINKAKRKFMELLQYGIKQAYLNTKFKRLSSELKKTARKVNVLNELVLPKTENTITYIISEQEDMAREELYRIKKIEAQKKQISVQPHAFNKSRKLTIKIAEEMSVRTSSYNKSHLEREQYEFLKKLVRIPLVMAENLIKSNLTRTKMCKNCKKHLCRAEPTLKLETEEKNIETRKKCPCKHKRKIK